MSIGLGPNRILYCPHMTRKKEEALLKVLNGEGIERRDRDRDRREGHLLLLQRTCLLSSIHMVTYHHLWFKFRVSGTLYWPPRVMSTHAVHLHIGNALMYVKWKIWYFYQILNRVKKILKVSKDKTTLSTLIFWPGALEKGAISCKLIKQGGEESVSVERSR